MGINFFGYAFGTGLGPFLVNWLHSISGGYESAFALMAVAAAVAAIGVAALWRRPLPYR